jgi:hypothetical protein
MTGIKYVVNITFRKRKVFDEIRDQTNGFRKVIK